MDAITNYLFYREKETINNNNNNNNNNNTTQEKMIERYLLFISWSTQIIIRVLRSNALMALQWSETY
jgi:hypothetical protein